MTKVEEINNILNYFKQLYIENPDLDICSDTFYNELCNYGFNKKELENKDIKYLFQYWIQYFKKSKNLNVYHTELQTRFLQFEIKNKYYAKCAKLYLSFAKEDIQECVKRIFEFIDQNNIVTNSKVSDVIRSDSVVLRIRNIEDAKKVIDFVNNDPYLSQKCRPTNPFLIHNGNIGLAYDDLLSYNSTLSNILAKYFTYCRKNNTLQEVSLEDFKNYIEFIYNEFFKNKENADIPEIRRKFSYDKDRYGSLNNLITNYQEIFYLIIKSLDPNINQDKYFEILEGFYQGKIKEEERKDSFDYEKLLKDYIIYATKKYGKENVLMYLNNYLYGNIRAITRDLNFRMLFMQYLPPEKIKEITNNNLQEYINMQQNNKTNIFIESCLATFNKYGINQLYTAIKQAMKNDYSYFTNGNKDYRKRLKEANCNDKILVYCLNFIRLYSNQELHMQAQNDIILEFSLAVSNYIKEYNLSEEPSSLKI